MSSLPIGIIGDELSNDLDEMIAHCLRLRIEHVEIRSVGGRNVLDLPSAELADVVDRLRGEGIEVTALATPLLKCQLPGSDGAAVGALHGSSSAQTVDDHLGVLPSVLETAARLSLPTVRIFSCWRVAEPTRVEHQVVELIHRVLEVAADYPVSVALENEHDCNVATAAETISILGRVPGLPVIWDPGNHVRAGGAPEDATLAGHGGRLASVHVKDVSPAGAWVPLGHGVVPYAAIVQQLALDGYQGVLTLETHCELAGSRIRATEHAIACLDEMTAVAA